jgi:hypothetical protein
MWKIYVFKVFYFFSVNSPTPLLLFKTTESLNSDGHQFHQHQQSKQSSLISTELSEHQKNHV